MNSTDKGLNQHQSRLPSQRIKPIIGFRAKFLCGTEDHMTCLSREFPKTLASVNLKIGIEPRIGNKGMRQLCQTLKHSKGLKKFIANISSCNNQQLRILAQWLRTFKSLKKLGLEFNWNKSQIDQGLTELLSHLKNSKDLNELDFEIKREYSERQSLDFKPPMKLRSLKRLQKIKMDRREKDLYSGHVIGLLRSMRNLENLSELDFNFVFCEGQMKKELEEDFFKSLNEMTNLKHLRINSTHNPNIKEETLDKLFSCICSLKNLISLHLMSGIDSSKMPKYVKILRENLKEKPFFKSLNLEAASQSHTDLLIEGLSFDRNDSLKSLKVNFSQSAFDTHDYFHQQMEMEKLYKSLINSPSLQSLDIFFPYVGLCKEVMKDFGQALPTLSQSLRSLEIALSCDYGLNTEKIGYVTAGIKTLKHLTNLNLDLKANNISNEGMRLLAESIDALENLQKLTLDLSKSRRPPPKNNFLSFFKKKDSIKTGLGYFGPVFQRHKNLRYLELDLDDLQPSPEEFEALAFGIEGLKTLKSFKLYSNDKRMKDEMLFSYRSLHIGLKTLPVLNSLVLKYHLVNSEVLENLFLHVGGFTSLVRLELRFGRLESLRYEAADYFAEALKKLKLLKSLHFDIFWREDNIEEEVIGRFHDGLRNIEYLEGFVWNFFRAKNMEQARRLVEKIKYMKLTSSFIRYRCLHQFALFPFMNPP